MALTTAAGVTPSPLAESRAVLSAGLGWPGLALWRQACFQAACLGIASVFCSQGAVALSGDSEKPLNPLYVVLRKSHDLRAPHGPPAPGHTTGDSGTETVSMT